MLTEHRSAVALAAVTMLFVAGVARLFHLRYEQGDIYPPYSSFRADPLGAKALYESLAALPGVKVARLSQPLDKLQGGPRAALFVFGATDYQLRNLDQDQFAALRRFLLNGGRAVFTIFPQGRALGWTNEDRELVPNKKTPPRPKHHVNTNDQDVDFGFQPVSLEAKFGFNLKARPLLVDDSRTRSEQARVENTNGGLPRLVSWHSATYFDAPRAPWRVLYRRQTLPVMIERPVGAGSLALASDSYFVSNEALRKERRPALLAWLAGGRSEIIFDETHLGVQERPGLAMLARKYRLTGAAGGLLLLAGLYLWRNAAGFVPPYQETGPEEQAGWVEGRDSASGLVSLLRRNVPPASILQVCVAQWKLSQGRASAAAQKIDAVERVAGREQSKPARARSPVAGYRAIQQILAKRA